MNHSTHTRTTPQAIASCGKASPLGARLLALLAILAVALGTCFFAATHNAFAGSPEAPSWDLQVYKSLSGDGITQEDLDKEHSLSVRVYVSLTEAARTDADKVALFKENFGEESSTVSISSPGTISRVRWTTDNPILSFFCEGAVKVTDKETPVPVVDMHLGISASHFGGALAAADLDLFYSITENTGGVQGDYDVYVNNEKVTAIGEGGPTWTKTYNSSTTNMLELFRSRDQIVVNNHKGTAFKEWKVKKVDAKTGEEIASTFEFTMKQRLCSSVYNENFNSIMADSGEAVALPYPAEYDVRETTPPDGYAPITESTFYRAGSDTFKVYIDSEGNLTVDETTGANVTVDADTLTITVPNYSYEDYTGDLKITKTLATSSGGEVPALIDADQEYTVKLRLRFFSDNVARGNNPFREGYSVSALWDEKTFGDVTFNDGIAEVKIKDGQTIELTGLPVVKDNAIYLGGTKTTIYEGITYSDLVVAIAEGDDEHANYTVTATGGDDSIDRTTYKPYSYSGNPAWSVVDAYAPIELQKTGEVAITNTIPVYDVTIRKVDGAGTQIAGAKLQVVDREDNVIDEWTTVAGEDHAIEGALLAGETYTLSEVEAPFGYAAADDVAFTVGDEGQILVGEEVVEGGMVVMEDAELAKGDITVTKKVTGGEADAAKAFAFTATFTDAEGEPIANQSFGEDTTDANGQIAFELKDGESKTIADIPNGVKYEIAEEDYTNDGYQAVSWDATPAGTIAGADPKSVVAFTATNAIETTVVDVSKAWDDAEDQDGLRPASVTVNLLADGEVVDSALLDEEGGWKYTFANLPKYASGAEVAYTVEEVADEGYTATVSGTAAEGYTITNTHAPAPNDDSADPRTAARAARTRASPATTTRTAARTRATPPRAAAPTTRSARAARAAGPRRAARAGRRATPRPRAPRRRPAPPRPLRPPRQGWGTRRCPAWWRPWRWPASRRRSTAGGVSKTSRTDSSPD